MQHVGNPLDQPEVVQPLELNPHSMWNGATRDDAFGTADNQEIIPDVGRWTYCPQDSAERRRHLSLP